MEKQSKYDWEAENKRYKLFSILIDRTLKSIHVFLYSLNLIYFAWNFFLHFLYPSATLMHQNDSKLIF